MKNTTKKWLAVSFTCIALASNTFAQESREARIGLGQESADSAPIVGRLQLRDPLIQQKYLNDPDMLRFLRATYSEACVRSSLVNLAKAAKLDIKKELPQSTRDAMGTFLTTNRLWKLSSLEMETIFPVTYPQTAFYCDCVLKEVSDLDLISPQKGIEVIKNLPESTTKMCKQSADEKILKYKSILQK